MDFLEKLNEHVEKGQLPEKFVSIFKDFYTNYLAAVSQQHTNLTTIQDQLNLSSDLTQDFLTKVLRAEHAGSVADLAQQDLADVTAYLQHLRSERLAQADAVEMELVSCGVAGSPVNLAQRLRIGALATAVTLLAVGLAQWWMKRQT